MKKFLIISLVFLIALSSLYAQDAGRFAFGARAGLQIGMGKAHDDFNAFINGSDVKLEVWPCGDLALYGIYGFTDNIALQTELNFMIGQGRLCRDTSITTDYVKITYSSLDIPLLLKINFSKTQSRYGILGGPYFTLPLGQASVTYEGFINPNEKTGINAPNTGFTVGFYYRGLAIQNLRWGIDARYIQDFGYSTLKKITVIDATTNNSVAISDFGFINRRGIVFTVGVEYSL